VRRRVLEASVRAPQEWHHDAISAAFTSDEEAWRLTAVFCMRFVRGFDDQILEALDSESTDVRYHAVIAAGNWEVADAWPHVAALVGAKDIDKPLLLAAIEAVGSIRPREALEILEDLRTSDDEDVVDAVNETLAIAGGLSREDDDDWAGER
ncbi:MAG: HEAT repeat domain-containing protein, partial [Vicinamibacteraceae bacterium]